MVDSDVTTKLTWGPRVILVKCESDKSQDEPSRDTSEPGSNTEAKADLSR